MGLKIVFEILNSNSSNSKFSLNFTNSNLSFCYPDYLCHFRPIFWPHITGPAPTISEVSPNHFSSLSLQGRGCIRLCRGDLPIKEKYSKMPFISAVTQPCLDSSVAAALLSSYYRASVNSIRGESKSFFKLIMAGEGPHQAMSWRLANWDLGGAILQFCCDSTPLVPTLQGQLQQYQMWV